MQALSLWPALSFGYPFKTATAPNLLVCQMVAVNRVQALVSSMMDVVIAEASLLKFILRCHQALKTWEAQRI
jgi:hypothetical protein